MGDLHYRQHPVSEIGSDRLRENIVVEKREGDKERERETERVRERERQTDREIDRESEEEIERV